MAAKTGLSGEYKGQKLRSFPEYVFAVYLDKVLKVIFLTEPYAFKSTVIKKRKIPDFYYINPKNNRPTFVEIKNNKRDLDETIVDYCTNKYEHISAFDVQFVVITGTKNSPIVLKICEAIGRDEWTKMSEEYKAISRANNIFFGFPGELNPNYGKHHSEETKAKISKAHTGKFVGENNPMFGKTHTEEAKVKIAAKWKDDEKKRIMLRDGMLTHVSNFSEEQFIEFTKYCDDRLKGLSHKAPKFVNRAYFVNKDKIKWLFKSIKGFRTAIRKARCDKN